MSLLTRALDPNNLRPVFDTLSIGRDIVSGIREDKDFLRLARHALFPLPLEREPRLEEDPFPPFDPFDANAFDSERLAVVASGGSGATCCVVGIQRALEEARLQPCAISASSGSVLFSALWACGLDSEAVARFWLTLPRRSYLDPDWVSLAKSAGRALGGWAGLVRGEALERSIRELVGDQRLGDTRIPFSMPAWNVDLNRIEFFGTRQTPDLPVARAVRTAISIPIFVEPVPIAGHMYGDGGIVNIFPVRPVLEEEPDRIIGLNCYLPENFAGEDVTGWRQHSFGILRASGQLRWSGMVALAREQALLAGDRLLLLHPVPYEEVRGARFYETFVDRSRWPQFMKAGRAEARRALSAPASGSKVPKRKSRPVRRGAPVEPSHPSPPSPAW
jgi:NTE family protein